MTEFTKPMPVPCKPQAWAAWLVKLMGWKIEFDGLPTKQGVLIGYPHTSNWDFITMMPVKWAVGLPVQFFAKESLFRIPLFGRWIRFIGAVPIDRSSPKGVVGEMVDSLKRHKQNDEVLWIGLSPEGTRKLTNGWRSGFYQLALGADVPLCMLRIDYGTKTAKITDFMRLTGDVQADYAHIAKVYEGVQGFHVNQAAPIRPLPPRTSVGVDAPNSASLIDHTMTTQTHEHVVTAARDYLIGLQRRITSAIEAKDGQAKFLVDKWEKGPGEQLQGNGITQILENGPVFERAGCGFSHVRGPKLPPSATQHRPELAGAPFEAMGVSLVFHPRNPYVPTVHMNVRMIVATPANGKPVAWFGGGMDLTPYYGFAEDAKHFHQVCHDALQPFGDELYPRFKTWCDEYFCNKHRSEQRGIGGIFFDDFSELGFDRSFEMLRSVGDAFLESYLPIVDRRVNTPYGEREREHQLYRRGRYVEFNLVWDRGTHFGLQSGGRTESILLSMPPLVSWSYQHQPEAGTPEHALLNDFLVPQDWLARQL